MLEDREDVNKAVDAGRDILTEEYEEGNEKERFIIGDILKDLDSLSDFRQQIAIRNISAELVIDTFIELADSLLAIVSVLKPPDNGEVAEVSSFPQCTVFALSIFLHSALQNQK